MCYSFTFLTLNWNLDWSFKYKKRDMTLEKFFNLLYISCLPDLRIDKIKNYWQLQQMGLKFQKS